MAVSGMGRSGLQKAEIRYGCKGSRQMVLGGKVRVGAAAHGQHQIPHLHIAVNRACGPHPDDCVHIIIVIELVRIDTHRGNAHAAALDR